MEDNIRADALMDAIDSLCQVQSKLRRMKVYRHLLLETNREYFAQNCLEAEKFLKNAIRNVEDEIENFDV